MASLSLQNFGTLVANMGAHVQGACSTLLDLSAGSVVRSIQEASAAQALWLQALILQVLLATRLATSTGSQVDSWFADFGLVREPAVPATGRITVSRYAPVAAATLVVGTNVLTGDGSRTFTVGADPAVPGYNATLGGGVGGYLIPAGTASLAGIPITAAAAGTAGNVVAGAITLVSGVPGIDYCANPAATSGGLDAESDASMRARFPLFIASLEKATLTAVESAIVGVQQGLTYRIQANTNEAGAFAPGHFVVTIDDGSGSPPAALRSEVYAAVDQVRALTETFSVQPPQVLFVSVTLTLTVGPGSSKAALAAPLASAITGYVNSLPVGAPLAIGRMVQLGFAASPYVQNVSGIAFNGVSQDLVPAANQVIKISSVTVS